MKQLLLCAALLHGACSLAQCTATNLGLDPLTQPNQFRDVELTGSGMVAVLKPYVGFLPVVFQPRGATVVKANNAGVPVWTRRLLPTNPLLRLDPAGVRTTLDDGAIVHGNLYRDTYVNQFVIKLSAAGVIEWARIYMLPDTNVAGLAYVNNRVVAENSLVVLDDGRYGWALGNEREFYHVVLDANGIPVSVRSYADPTYPMRYALVHLQADGSWYCAHSGQVGADVYGGYFKVAADGQVAWGKRIPYMVYPGGVGAAVNGDLLVVTEDIATGQSMLRVDSSDGTVLWRRQGAGAYCTELAGSADGTIVGLNVGHFMQYSSGGTQLMHLDFLSSGFQDLSVSGDRVLATAGSANQHPTFLLADAMGGMGTSCGLITSALENITLGSIAPTANAIVRDTTGINTWTLAMNDLTGNDLDLVANMYVGGARPGSSAYLTGAVSNPTGTNGGPVTVTCVLPDLMTPMQFNPPPTTISGNVLSWTIPDGIASDVVWFFHGQGALPPDPLLIGTTITTSLTVSSPAGETNTSNNTHTYTREITASYDPNDKLVRTSSGLSDSLYYYTADEWLDYTIRFQNTGNDTAFNVVLVDTLPPTLRVGSFLPMGATHAYTYELNGAGLLRFTFNNILLPDSTTNEAASKGHVSFRIRPEQGLAPGTALINRADIFFDINEPVTTPDATVTIAGPLTVPDATSGEVLVYPVPSTGTLSAVLPAGFAAWRWTIRTAEGRHVSTRSMPPLSGRIDLPIHELARGTYLLTLEGAGGQRLSGRFVKVED